MIEHRREGGEERPFLRTLHGGAGVPGSEVVTEGSGNIYQLGVQLGSCGDVFELEEDAIGEPAVIKLFPRAAGIDERIVDAFAQTARRATALGHPNIARVFDAGALQSGTPILVVERLPGETLKDLLSRRAALPLADSLFILRAVGGALSAAHAAGIIHGELRPDNVFIDIDGSNGGRVASVKLLDFGAASLTAPLRQMGIAPNDEALSFLAPEQLQVGPEEWDGRTDEYALAVLAHRLLAYSQARRSPALTAVLNMAMNQRAGDRFISVQQFTTALGEVVGTGTQAAAAAPRETLRPAAAPRETLRPLSDLDITPTGGVAPSLRDASRRTPSARSSRPFGAVTGQFFEDGNRLSEEADAAPAARSDLSMSASLSPSMSVMRIPTSAAHKVAVVVAGAAMVAVVAAAWAGVWNPIMAVGSRGRVLLAHRAPITATTPASSPVAPPSPRAVSPAPEPAAPASATASARPADPPAITATAPPRESATAAAAAPRKSQPSSEHRSEVAHRGNKWSDPLHGYVWSPGEGRLVPSEPAVETGVPPSTEPAPPSPTRTTAPPSPTAPILDDMPMPLSSQPTQPPPQPAPPIVDSKSAR